MAAGILEVDIVARTEKLEQGLAKANERMQKTGETIDKSLGSGGAKAAMAMGKVFAVMGAVEGAAKGISAATELTRGIFAGLTGDAEEFERAMGKSAELLKGLPFGIGPVVQGIEDLIMSVGGFNASLAASQKELEEWTSFLEYQKVGKGIEQANIQLADQRDLLKETDTLRKEELKLELELAAIQREKVRRGQEILKNEDMSDASKRRILKALREEFAIRKEMAQISGRQAIEAEQQRRGELFANGLMDVFAKSGKAMDEQRKRLADERKKAEDELAKKRKEEINQLKEANKMEDERLGKINSRLGMAAGGGAGAKSGFTNTAATAMGAFTFAEHGAQDAMEALAKEAKDIQQRIDSTATRTEQILKQLATKIGFT